MRQALFSLCDSAFLPGYIAFMKSFLHFNPWFDHEFVVLDVGLGEQGREAMLKYYRNIRFLSPEKGNYKAVDMSRTADTLKKTYYTLDVFRLTEYDRITAIDMDVLVLGDIKAVFDCEAPLAMVRGYNAKLDELRRDFNSGVFTVNKPYIGDEHYRKLLDLARRGHSMPDQKVINSYFAGQIHELPKIYNVEKRMISTKAFKDVLDNARIIHFVASKPWQEQREPGFEALETLWQEWYER
jgi:lipopolysaccharide biosynthesis glycosyltransferase